MRDNDLLTALLPLRALGFKTVKPQSLPLTAVNYERGVKEINRGRDGDERELTHEIEGC